MNQLTSAVCGSLLISVFLAPPAAAVEIYTCRDDDGSITYAQTPCPNVEKKSTSASKAKDREPADCRFAGRFARSTAMSMRNGAGSDEIFDLYGGLDSLSSSTIGLINYVYLYRTKKDVSAARIASLAEAKCGANSFGNVACGDLPYSFTDELGGCDSAAEEKKSEQSAIVAERPTQSPARASNFGVTKTKLATDAPALIAEDPALCRRQYRDQINQIDGQMRSGYSSAQGDSLGEKRRKLQRELSKC